MGINRTQHLLMNNLLRTECFFCLSAKEPKQGSCTQTKAEGSQRCTASFFIEPSWKQASTGFFAFRQKNQNGTLVPKRKPQAAGAALRLFSQNQAGSKLPLGSMKKAGHPSVSGFLFVSHTGFEPVTSALSRQRSKPTELMALTVLSTNILT